MREGLGIYAGVLALRHGAPPGITFYEWEGWGERTRAGGDEGRTQRVCASPSEAAGVGTESKLQEELEHSSWEHGFSVWVVS